MLTFNEECQLLPGSGKPLSQLSNQEKIALMVNYFVEGFSQNKEYCKLFITSLREIATGQSVYLPYFLDLKKSKKQEARDLAGELSNSLSQSDLINNFDYLAEKVFSDYPLVKGEAIRLILKINPVFLGDKFEWAFNLRKVADFDTLRFCKKLLAGMIKEMSSEEAVNLNFFADVLRLENDKELQALGNQMFLKAVDSWEFDYQTFSKLLFFFKEESFSANSETEELAAWFAYQTLVVADDLTKLENIQFMTSFITHGSKQLRQGYRALALETAKMLNEDQLPYFSTFFIACLDASVEKDRKKAKEFLAKIDPDSLPLDQLINTQGSKLYRVRKTGKRLLKKVSSKKLAADLEILFTASRSICRRTREAAFRLSSRIPHQLVSDQKIYLKRQSESTNINVRLIAYLLLSR